MIESKSGSAIIIITILHHNGLIYGFHAEAKANSDYMDAQLESTGCPWESPSVRWRTKENPKVASIDILGKAINLRPIFKGDKMEIRMD